MPFETRCSSRGSRSRASRISWERRPSCDPRGGVIRPSPRQVLPGSRRSPSSLASAQCCFFVEWRLLGDHPRLASGLVYFHASVLGAIGISAFWSLLNERFDPHSAKALMARVAAAATLVAWLGASARSASRPSSSQGALFTLLGLLAGASVVGSAVIGRGMPPRRGRTGGPGGAPERIGPRSGACPLLREPALWSFAAALAALMDYRLKAEVVTWLGKGEPLVRFFGLFYAATGLARIPATGQPRPLDSCPDSGSQARWPATLCS